MTSISCRSMFPAPPSGTRVHPGSTSARPASHYQYRDCPSAGRCARARCRASRSQTRERHSHTGGRNQGPRLWPRQDWQHRGRSLENEVNRAGAILGTPGYISPEQLRGAGADFRADLFSFGVMLYELASGVHPFTSSNPASTIARVLEADPPDVAELSSSCPPALDELIHRCLQKEPRLRYGSTHELVAALEQLRRDTAEEQPGMSSAHPTPAGQPPSDSRTGPRLVVAIPSGPGRIVYYLTLIPMWIVRGQTLSPGAHCCSSRWSRR